jgi:hypothetical protein
MHFGRVKIGEHYSVSPEATLGPTVREIKKDKIMRVSEIRDFEE